MWAMPLPFLLNRIAGLISLLIPITGLWLTAAWLHDPEQGRTWLVIGVALLAISVAGRKAALMALPHDPGVPPEPSPPSEYEHLTGAGGAMLATEQLGPKAAPVLVLTHGWGASREVWRPLVPWLSQRYRVVLWDMAGHGASGRPYDGIYSIRRAGEDLRMLLQLAQGRKIVMVGRSSGAQAVLSLLSDHPELMGPSIVGVVLVNGAPASPIFSSDGATALTWAKIPLIEPLARLSVWLSPVFTLAGWASWFNGATMLMALTLGFGPDPDRECVDLACRYAAKTHPDVMAKGMRALLDWRADGLVERITVPLLALCGGADVIVTPEAAETATLRAPAGEVVVIPHTGHFGQLEAPEAYARAILAHADKSMELARNIDWKKKDRTVRQPELVEPRSWDSPEDRDEAPADGFPPDDPDRPAGRA